MHQPSIQDLFVDLLSDWGFKWVFWKPANKELLIHLINTLLNGKTVIKDLRYMNVEKVRKHEESRAAFLDLYCITEQDENIIIEVQRLPDAGFIPRSVFYASHVLQEQSEQGKDWQFKFKPTYVIGILDFAIKASTSDHITRSVMLLDEATPEVIYSDLTFIFVELPKFKRQLNELETDLDYWLFCFRYLPNLRERPALLERKDIFKKLMDAAELAKMSRDERWEYVQTIGAEWKAYTTRETHINMGEKKGKSKALKVANAYLNKKQSPDQIAASLSLPLTEVLDIINELESY